MNNEITRRCILYYPTITIPTGGWLRNALLYWDEIGSIVPQNWDNKALIDLGPDLEFLKNEGEFRMFDPQKIINKNSGWKKLQELEKEIKSIIESELFQTLLKQSSMHLSSHVHVDKVSRELFREFLSPNGLAKEDDVDCDWYLMEKNTALLYMSLLAKELADLDIHATVSGTDRVEYQNLIYGTSPMSNGYACLDTRFNNSLPIPSEDTSLSDIIIFKHKRREELLNFRKLISEFQKKLSNANEIGELKEIIIDFKETHEKGVLDLSKLMQDSKIASIAGSLKTIINIKSPTLIGTFCVVEGHASKIAELPVEWAVAGLAIMGLIEVGCYFIDNRNKNRATIRDSAFSYLYHAQSEGLLTCERTNPN